MRQALRLSFIEEMNIIMNEIINKLKNKAPNYFKEFSLSEYTGQSLREWQNKEEFVSKKVSCQCGQQELLIFVTNKIQIKGLFKKKEVKIPLAPIYLQCPKCNKQPLFFNPHLNGWDAELSQSVCEIGEGEAELYLQKSGLVVICYSYQNVENYEELIEGGFEYPENCFDTFSVYFKANGQFEEVVSYECA